MAVKLITGHQKTNHILSVDARQFNRGVFGQSNYRIFDGGRNNVIITPGTINISTGGLIIFGLHVRVTQTTLTYASPASKKEYGIFTHYHRDDENDGIETVTFEVFAMDSAPETTTIITDSNGDAYALFYSFTDNAGASVTNEKHHFPVINTLDDISNYHSKVNERVTLATSISAGTTKKLSESIANFREIEIWIGRTFVKFPTAELATFLDNGYHTFMLTGGANASEGEGTVGMVFRTVKTKISGTSFQYYKGGQIALFLNGGILRSPFTNNPAITKVVGVGRI